MVTPLRAAFDRELASARAARARGDLGLAFQHLERAHILGQRYTRLHVRSHLDMLSVGWQRRDMREVFGQLSRILAASLFSRIWVPLGNTGGASVSAVQPMTVPEDLARILAADAAP
jgi:hypothetical protein